MPHETEATWEKKSRHYIHPPELVIWFRHPRAVFTAKLQPHLNSCQCKYLYWWDCCALPPTHTHTPPLSSWFFNLCTFSFIYLGRATTPRKQLGRKLKGIWENTYPSEQSDTRDSKAEFLVASSAPHFSFIYSVHVRISKAKTAWCNRQVWLRVQNEVGQRLTEFCQENELVIANTLFQ